MRRLAAFALAALLSLPALAALKTGAAAPMFTAPAWLAGKQIRFDLAQALKRGPVVLYFFPAAHTPGCNVEASLFSQAIDKFKAQGATVIGITAGNLDSLAKFSMETEHCSGKFAVAADEGAKIAKSFDATLALKPNLSSRTSYVIAQDGRIAFVHDAMNPNLHVRETLRAVTELQANKPAK
ncbi:MAG: peroxiredoxin [Thermomonas sp.]|uniref:peroxiredoxin n=1 Tax=Thermomonas sp. TaxID=1971895 RepID=UPI0039E454BA